MPPGKERLAERSRGMTVSFQLNLFKVKRLVAKSTRFPHHRDCSPLATVLNPGVQGTFDGDSPGVGDLAEIFFAEPVHGNLDDEPLVGLDERLVESIVGQFSSGKFAPQGIRPNPGGSLLPLGQFLDVRIECGSDIQ